MTPLTPKTKLLAKVKTAHTAAKAVGCLLPELRSNSMLLQISQAHNWYYCLGGLISVMWPLLPKQKLGLAPKLQCLPFFGERANVAPCHTEGVAFNSCPINIPWSSFSDGVKCCRRQRSWEDPVCKLNSLNTTQYKIISIAHVLKEIVRIIWKLNILILFVPVLHK